MPEMTGTYANVQWTTSEFSDHPCPEVLITRANSPEEAQTAFRDHIRRCGMEWENLEMEVHLGDGVAHLTLEPPEPSEDDEYP